MVLVQSGCFKMRSSSEKDQHEVICKDTTNIREADALSKSSLTSKGVKYFSEMTLTI